MPSIDLTITQNHSNVNLDAKPIKKKKRRFIRFLLEAVNQEVEILLVVEFFKEVT